MYDIVIKNGKIISGCGNPWYKADIGIIGDTISHIGNISEKDANEIVDAEDLIVCPGFIDAHSHGDLRILGEPTASEKLMQGVTTEINGQCGIGIAPIKNEDKENWRNYIYGIFGEYPEIHFNWNTLEQYLKEVEKKQPSINAGYLVTFGAARLMVMGFDSREPNDDEIKKIVQIIDESMKSGAFGMSLGMIYVPTVFATNRELIETCKIVAENNGVVGIHMRNEGNDLINSVQEVINLTKETGVSFQISHLKAGGKNNWHKSIDKVIKMIELAREDGFDITFDQYPYDSCSTMLRQVLPPWVLDGGNEKMKARISDKDIRVKVNRQINGESPVDGLTSKAGWDNYANLGGWDGILITSVKSKNSQKCLGKTIKQLSDEMNKEPIDVVCDLLIKEDGAVGMAVYMMCEDDVKTILKHELGMVGTDGLYGGKPHPRLYGTFPKILGKYVRQENLISLTTAIRKITSYPAQRYGIRDRGMILQGMKADITIFDENKIIDNSTFNDPFHYPDGIKYVLVNGKIEVKNNKIVNKGNGNVLLKK
ncbi:amidohydrolase family protein [Clostridium sp. MT-14]|uniref:D-aminoacylase n=1 Tax=Clostridium aromativorans TaxID=2836848 RepID=A0ABS8N9U0_9CLOT|nr:D-aminoacylase [Clostridium aromativorans]MCC9296588.1 D-aminoacylase [Clostridium aromativorans]